MADIRVRKLEDWVVAVHRRLAKSDGDSLENHLRQLLKASAIESQKRFADQAEQDLQVFEEKYGILSDSAEGISEERWQRG